MENLQLGSRVLGTELGVRAGSGRRRRHEGLLMVRSYRNTALGGCPTVTWFRLMNSPAANDGALPVPAGLVEHPVGSTRQPSGSRRHETPSQGAISREGDNTNATTAVAR